MRAVIYTRVSTVDQAEGMSLETQREAGAKRAEALGAEVVGVLEDTFTGTDLGRPAMDRLREMVERRDVEIVIVYDPDRFSRNLTDLLVVTKEFEKHGVSLEYVNFEWKDTPQGRLFLQVRGAFAEFEHAQILERTSRGKRKVAQLGRPHHFIQPYGYRHEPGQGIAVDRAAAPVVERIFRMYADEELGLRDICRRLVADGVAGPRVAAWNISTLHGILRNRTYLGEVHRVGVPEGSQPLRVEPLIGEDLFERAQDRMARLRTGRRRRNVDEWFLLQGLGVCVNGMGRDEHRMGVFVSQRPLQGGGTARYPYYRCVRREPGARYDGTDVRCAGPSVRADIVDARLWSQVRSLLADPELFEERLAATHGADGLEKRVREARELEDRLTKTLLRLEEEHLGGDIPSERYLVHKANFNRRLDAARRDRKQLEKNLKVFEARQAASTEVGELARRYAQSLDDLSFETKRAIVAALVDKAVFADGEVRIIGRGVAFDSVVASRSRVS